MKSIKVWEFDKAPKRLQALSTNGGDEDWIVLIPAKLVESTVKDWTPHWILKTDTCNEPKEYKLPNGDVVYIGAHA